MADEKCLQKDKPGAGRQEGDPKAREVPREQQAPGCVWGHPGDGAGTAGQGEVEPVTSHGRRDLEARIKLWISRR